MGHQTTSANYGKSAVHLKPNLSVITFSITPAPSFIPTKAISNRSHVKSAQSISGAMFRHNRQPKMQITSSQNRQYSAKVTGDIIQKNSDMKASNICKHVATYFLGVTSQWNHEINCYPSQPKTTSRSLSMSQQIMKQRSKSASSVVRKPETTRISLVLEGKQQPIKERQ